MIWVYQTHVFESGQIVLKELKGTYFDAYLWQTMWNHAKKSMEELKLPDSVFLQGDGRSSGLKTLKTAKTMKTKTPVSQNFQILWPTQGGTMWKGMARAFRKCVTYGGGVVLIHSYKPSKSVQISINFSVERRRHKKITLVQFWDLRSVTNRSSAQWGCLQLLFVAEPNLQNWMSVIFLWRLLLSMTKQFFPTLSTSARYNTVCKAHYPLMLYIFLTVRTSAFIWWYPGYMLHKQNLN